MLYQDEHILHVDGDDSPAIEIVAGTYCCSFSDLYDVLLYRPIWPRF